MIRFTVLYCRIILVCKLDIYLKYRSPNANYLNHSELIVSKIYIMLNTIINTIKIVTIYIVRFIARVILLHILGWKIISSNLDVMTFNRQILVYCYTSHFDTLIYILYCLVRPVVDRKNIVFVTYCNFPFVLIAILRLIRIDLIKLDRSNSINSSTNIIENLQSRSEFIFGINPEGSRYKVSDINSGFYQLAKETSANILLLSFDYETQCIKTSIVATSSIHESITYDDIKQKLLKLLLKEKVFNQLNFGFIKPSNTRRSIINPKRSVIIYAFPTIVLIIIWQSFISLFIKLT
jgi:hypothetical protein